MKKKIFMIIIVMVLMVTLIPSVNAINIRGCDSIIPGVNIDVKIANTVHTIITVIKIAVPVILVIFGMIDLFKGITAQKEDEIKKGQQMFIKRLISAAIIFFVVSIVQLIISFVSDDDGITTCASCFFNGANTVTGTCNK